MKRYKYYLFIALIPVLIAACKKNYDYDFSAADGVNRYPIDWNAAADSSTGFLIGDFWNASPGYFKESTSSPGFQYWPQAHGLDVLTDAYLRTGDNKYSAYFDNWYNGVKQENGNTFLGYFYDDMGWNALAMLRVYEAANDSKFKDAVSDVWADIQGGWDSNLGGGIYWNKDRKYKNTPANGPACILATRLYLLTKNQDDLNWALKIYNWLKDSLCDPGGYVYDGMNMDGSRVAYTLTYNQGLMIGAANELYNATKDPVYLNDAQNFADYALSSTSYTTADRLLSDEGGGDGGLFKGIFIRYFTQLILNPDLDKAVKNRYITFLKLNAQTLWYEGTNKQSGLYGTYWKTAPDGSSPTDLTVEESGCMLMEAAALLNKDKLLQ